MKKGFAVFYVLIIIVLIAGVLFVFKPPNNNGGSAPNGTKRNEGGNVDDKFITSNPLDLDQIESISAFRSCEGHDYSAENADGENETGRSMKHYITPRKNTITAKTIAPFDGIIGSIEVEEVKRGAQVWLSPNANPAYSFVFFHIDLLPEYKKGSRVRTGELIGHSTILENGENFDIALKRFGKFSQILETPFNYMSPNVLGEYSQVGVTLENIVLSKTFRDLNPCPIIPGSESRHDSLFKPANPGERAEDWVTLKH